MKSDLNQIDRTQFNVDEHNLNGELVYLVTPKTMGCNWNPENSIFRSSVWDVEGNPVSLSFKKFVNWGEKPEQFPVPSSLDDCSVMEKLDGCCDENTILVTETGEKTIKQICESKYKGKVLGFDIDANCEVWTEILEHSIKSNNNDWYKIELMDGKTITLTGNHKVWLPELNCYRKVSDLTECDVILLKK